MMLGARWRAQEPRPSLSDVLLFAENRVSAIEPTMGLICIGQRSPIVVGEDKGGEFNQMFRYNAASVTRRKTDKEKRKNYCRRIVYCGLCDNVL